MSPRVEHYRGVIAPQIGAPFGRATARIIRKYNRESPLGNLIADAMRRSSGADAALTNAGGLRADLPEGPIDHGRVLDAFPFLNDNVVVELPGAALRGVVEHGLSLLAGMCQVSGLRATYDLQRPVGARLVSLEVGDAPVADAKSYRVATNSFLAEGGDGYAAFLRGRVVAKGKLLSEVLSDYVRERQPPGAARVRRSRP